MFENKKIMLILKNGTCRVGTFVDKDETFIYYNNVKGDNHSLNKDFIVEIKEIKEFTVRVD